MNFYQRMGILDLKKHVNRNKCSFATKKRMFGVFAIDKILRYRGTRFPGSRTLCHPGSDKRKWPDGRIENCWTKKKFWMKMKFKGLRVIDIIQIVPSKEDCKFKDMWVKIYLVPFPVCLPDLCSIFKIALYLTHIPDILLIYLYIWHILLYSVFCWQAKNGPLSFLPLPNILYLSYICWSFSVHDIC